MSTKRMVDALEAVLLFHSGGQWDDAAKARWLELTQTNDATTRTLCDTVRMALGRLPSLFGTFTGKTPQDLPKDLPLTHEQRAALVALDWIKKETSMRTEAEIQQALACMIEVAGHSLIVENDTEAATFIAAHASPLAWVLKRDDEPFSRFYAETAALLKKSKQPPEEGP